MSIAILSIKGIDYCCIISRIIKIEGINLMQNSDLTEKCGTVKTKKLFSYIKMGKETLTFGNIEIEKFFLPQ